MAISSEDYTPLAGDLTAVFYLGVGGLYLRHSDLGMTLTAKRQGKRVRVTFPDANGSFPGETRPPSMAIGGRRGPEEGPGSRYIVNAVQVAVALGRGLGDEGSGNAEVALLDEASPLAATVARELVEWARTFDRQPWLPPPHAALEEVTAPYLLNDEGARARGYGRTHTVIVVHGDEGLPSGDLARALDGDEIPLAESLLAEARWAIWPTNEDDTKRAVLFAAVALEVKTAEALRSRVDSQASSLLDALYERRMPVRYQLTTVATAILGASIASVESGALDRQVKALYEWRNGIAHRGRTPSKEEALSGVAAAEWAFAWLDSM